jgi:phosphotransferase system HPr-like phosphotransfer protein
MLMVMSLGLRKGEEVVLTAPEEHAVGTLDELVTLVATDWDAQ